MTLPYRLQMAVLRVTLGLYARWHRLTPWERVRAVGMSGQYLSWSGSLTRAIRTGASAIRTFAGGRILNRRPKLPIYSALSRRVAAMQLVGGVPELAPPASAIPRMTPRESVPAPSGGADATRKPEP